MFQVCLLSAAFVAGSSLRADEPLPAPVITVPLTIEPTKLSFEGSRNMGMMSMPGRMDLAAAKPSGVKKEPTYRGTPLYGTFRLGDDPARVVAFDDADPPKVYPDLNGDGDLANDTDGSWEKLTSSNGGNECSGTFIFQTSWAQTSGPYGINIFHSPDRPSAGYYRATAATGKAVVNGKEHTFFLVENDNDGNFHKPLDPAAKTLEAIKNKPVLLTIDGTTRADLRLNFGFEGINYIAQVTPDGRTLTMTPSYKSIALPPRGAEPPKMVSYGNVPDFTAESFGGGEFRSTAMKGKVWVLDLWATWCGPCMKGLPHMAKVAEACKGQNVEFIALNVYDDKAAYEKFAAGKKDWPVKFVFDPAGRQSDMSIAKLRFNVTGIPATYVIDAEGKIIASISGFDEKSTELEDGLTKAGIKIPGHTPKPERKSIPATGMGAPMR